jgi:sterol desaturase/sphingolipid hydroxylase (fatty acid hydroxylase superfamily)
MNSVVLYAIPFFVLTMLGEWQLLREQRAARGYTPIDTAASLSMGTGYLVIAAAAALFTVPLYTWIASFAVTDLGGHWWTWPALILAEDFCYYWYHRAGHEVRLFWASHVNHHSSRHYNLSTALRQSWTTPFTGWVFWVPMLLGGFPVELVLLQKGISLLYQYWIHTELIGRMGPLEWVMNTPSHHRVHHGRNLRYLDRNYGGIFIIWDRLFGTFQVEDEPVEYGLIHNLESHNPVVIAMHEWWAIGRDIAARPAAALSLLFHPPGWAPDGKGTTVKQMLAAEQVSKAEATP